MSNRVHYKSYARPGWIPDDRAWSIRLRCYHMPAVFETDIPGISTIVDHDDFRVIVLSGTLRYFHVSGEWIEVTPERKTMFRTPKEQGLTSTPDGTYLVVMVPSIDGTSPPFDVIEGLLAVVGGKTVIYRQVFDNEVYSDGRIAAYAHAVETPAIYDIPDFKAGEMAIVSEIHAAMKKLPAAERSQVELALRWIGRGVNLNGVDAYLHLWVALETLAMPDTSNIRPAELVLAQGYNMTLEETRRSFGLGRLQGIRANIVHDGLRLQVPTAVLKYLTAMLFDVLTLRLGLPFERRAERKLSEGEFSVSRWWTEAA